MQANRCHLRTFLPQYMDYHLRYMVISMVARHPLYRHQNKVIFFPGKSAFAAARRSNNVTNFVPFSTRPLVCFNCSIVRFLTIMVDPSCLPGCDNASYPGMSVFQII